MNILNDASKKETAEKPSHIIHREIDIDEIVPSKENFYSVKELEDLKASIEMFGVLQEILVQEIDDGKVEIIAGHRRYIASRQLVEEGKEEFRKLPCRVETNVEKIREKIMMIITNSTARELSSWEKVQQAAELKKYLKEYSKDHELPGRMRDYIAEALNVSKTTAGRLETTDKNLSDDFKEELKSDNISLSTAAELSRLSPEDQKAVYEKTGGKAKLSDVNQKNDMIDLEQNTELTGNEIDEELENYTEGPCNECGMYRDEYIEESVLIIPKKYKMTLKIEIAHDPRDGKYRAGINMSKSDRGLSYGPGDTDEAYDTKQEAFAAAIMDMAESDDDVEQALIAGGYIKTDTAKGKSQLPAADTEHRIYAVKSTMDILQKQIEKEASWKKIDEEEGNAEGAANRSAQIEYLGELLERVQEDMFELSGQDIFKGAEK